MVRLRHHQHQGGCVRDDRGSVRGDHIGCLRGEVRRYGRLRASMRDGRERHHLRRGLQVQQQQLPSEDILQHHHLQRRGSNHRYQHRVQLHHRDPGPELHARHQHPRRSAVHHRVERLLHSSPLQSPLRASLHQPSQRVLLSLRHPVPGVGSHEHQPQGLGGLREQRHGLQLPQGVPAGGEHLRHALLRGLPAVSAHLHQHLQEVGLRGRVGYQGREHHRPADMAPQRLQPRGDRVPHSGQLRDRLVRQHLLQPQPCAAGVRPRDERRRYLRDRRDQDRGDRFDGPLLSGSPRDLRQRRRLRPVRGGDEERERTELPGEALPIQAERRLRGSRDHRVRLRSRLRIGRVGVRGNPHLFHTTRGGQVSGIRDPHIIHGGDYLWHLRHADYHRSVDECHHDHYPDRGRCHYSQDHSCHGQFRYSNHEKLRVPRVKHRCRGHGSHQEHRHGNGDTSQQHLYRDNHIS